MPKKFNTRDITGWGLSVVLGGASIWLPGLVGLRAKGLMGLVVMHLGLLVAGAIVGFLRPERVWRWGVGCVSPLPVIYVLERALSPSRGPLSVGDSLLVVVMNMPVYGLQSLLAIVGAYLAAVARVGIPPSEDLKKDWRRSRLWGLAFLLGFASAAIPLIATQLLNPAVNAFHLPVTMLVWGAGIFLSVVVMVLLQADPTRRYWLAVILGSIGGVILKVLIDVLRDPDSTHSLSLPIIFSLFFAAPCTFGGILIGTSIKGRFPNFLTGKGFKASG